MLPPLVFLDLPAPWEAIGHAKLALRVRFLSSEMGLTAPLTHLHLVAERASHTHLLLQSMHGASLTHRQRFE